VIRLIIDLLIANDDEKLTGSGIIRQVYDPACGTGGMLTLAEAALRGFNDKIHVQLFGQGSTANPSASARSDMLVTGHDPERIEFGNTLTHDAHANKHFHYMLSNPPYGVDWKKYKERIRSEFENMGFDGRFEAGLPRISDGQLLFLQHMIAKIHDDEVGSRIEVVMNGSVLFTGGMGSGESEIRRWMPEQDWGEVIVALPADLFHNTGIQTYVRLPTNRKPEGRRGKMQLIDAGGERFWRPTSVPAKTASPKQTPTCAITSLCRWARTGGITWRAKCCPSCTTPGSRRSTRTPATAKSAMISTSTATSTDTCRRARLRRSTRS